MKAYILNHFIINFKLFLCKLNFHKWDFINIPYEPKIIFLGVYISKNFRKCIKCEKIEEEIIPEETMKGEWRKING